MQDPTTKPEHVLLLDVLSVASFRYLWIAQILTQVAVNMTLFIVGLMIYETTHSNAAVSILYVAFGLPAAVSGVLSGVVVDHFSKRRILFVTTLLRSLIVWALFFTQSNLVGMYILVALLSILSQFFVPAEAALIPRLFPKNLLLSANSLFILSFYVAIIGGFVLAGPFLNIFSQGAVIAGLGAVFLISTAILGLVKLPTMHSALQARRLTMNETWREIKSALSFVYHFSLVKHAIALLVMAQVIVAIFVTLGPGFVDQGFALKISDSSLLLLGPAAIGLIVGVLLIGQIGGRFRKRTLIEIGVFASGLLLMLLAAIVTLHDKWWLVKILRSQPTQSIYSIVLPLVMLCFLLLGFANSLIDVTCNTVLQEHTPDDTRGRVYGIVGSLISGAALVPVIVSGILADVFGISAVIFGIGLILVLFGGTISWHSRKMPAGQE